MKKARYLVSAAMLALAGASLLAPAASAATTPPGSAAAATPTATTSGPGFTVTGTIAGTSVLCTSHWNWYVSWPPAGGYSQVEWTSNPCGFKIEDRSRCESFIEGGNAHYNDSGIVTRTGLWAQAGCGISEEITWAQERFFSGSGWSSWNQYWSRP